MTPARKLRIAYTPDSDDAFNFYAWEQGRITLGADGFVPEFHRHHIQELNMAASRDEYDVVAISSAFYPLVADRYRILAVGNSIGRDFGPVLVSKRYGSAEELRGKRVAIAGHPTTGSILALMYCPGAEFIEWPYDRIADAIGRDEFDAGVMIHEELLYFAEKGLRCVCDFGKLWCKDTGLPLPVGLNLVCRELGIETARAIATACQRSLLWGFEHPDEAYAFAGRFGRGKARKHVAMFHNQDTLCMPQDARRALRVMFDRVTTLGISRRVAEYEIVDGDEAQPEETVRR